MKPKSKRKKPELKELFRERMQKLLPNEKDFEKYLKILDVLPVKSIRCNTLKISVKDLKTRLEKKGWKISQPWKSGPEVMIVENDLMPGELGRSEEHLLGYYYIQELASMLPILALKPNEGENFFDMCAAPGSKTTQAAAEMKNTGTIIANEVSMGRMRILASNTERCGVTNTIIIKRDGAALKNKFQEIPLKFDKILVDAPCSGEGTLRSSPKTYTMWNIKTVNNLPKIQKRLFISAFNNLKINGEIIYSTCTHAPEENEAVVSEILEELKDKIEILDVKKDLPKELKLRDGITEWQNEKFDSKVKLCARVYPHDNDTEGFFVSKFRKIKE